MTVFQDKKNRKFKISPPAYQILYSMFKTGRPNTNSRLTIKLAAPTRENAREI